MTESDWPQVAAIWAEGIATGNATFETEPPSWSDFDATRRPRGPARRRGGRRGRRLGGALAVSARACYAGVAENSVVRRLHGSRPGRRRHLMRELVAAAGAAGIWTIQTSVFPENAASIALHERAGFRVVGRRERIASSTGLARHGVPGAPPPVTRPRGREAQASSCQRRKTRHALCPPKPNEFETPISTCSRRASFGM